MASKNIVAKGTTYNGVESVTFPVSGGGDATFYEISDTTCTASDVLNSKYFYSSSGVKTQGTGTVPSPTLITKSITANGTYNASSDNADGYSSVTVSVSGGGGQYAWFGQGTTYVNRLYSETVNLKDDTTYDSWTASTSYVDIKPASSTTDFSVTVDYDNVYWLVVRYYVDIAYVSGITLQKVPKNFACYLVSALNPQYSLYNPLVNDYYNTVVATTVFSKYGFLYYNNSGSLAYGNDINYGPMFCTSMPTYATSGLIFDFKFGTIRARCNSTYFDTTQKVNIDSANTNMVITVDVYKTPVENTFFGEMQKNMRTDLLS